MFTILVHAEDGRDQRITQNICALLQSAAPDQRVLNYAQIGYFSRKSDYCKIQQQFNARADAVLLLVSADYLNNQDLMAEIRQILRQRADLLAAHRIFVLLIRPVLWDTGAFGDSLVILNGGNPPRNEAGRAKALKEMLQACAQPGQNCPALPEPGVIDA